MISLARKTVASFKQLGFKETLIRIVQYPFRGRIARHRRREFERSILARESIEERFTKIYETNYWGSHESVSGYGSTLESTENVRAVLPELFRKYSIHSVFDAPCGDFNWMQHVLKRCNVRYIGGDIVFPLIQKLNARYASSNIKFIHIDLTKDQFPYADIMICRDCLFHLSYEDTLKLLKNFVKSEIPLLLTTTYVNASQFSNRDIVSGDARAIDLFAPPFNFDKDVLFRFEDPKTQLR